MRISNLTAYKNIESFKLCFNFAQPSTARISDCANLRLSKVRETL